MTRILLARHGNTFGPSDKIVWVGAREDLPLVESGEAQARALGTALHDADLTPGAIICGPLKRTRRAAEIVAELTGFSGQLEIDQRLREIDYGSWGGKSNDEIEAEFGAASLAEWDQHHRRPSGVDWSPAEWELKTNALAAMQAAATRSNLPLLITSNGILRYVYGTTNGPDAAAKVKTGNMCAVEIKDDAATRMFWNEKPQSALLTDAFA